MPPHLGFTIINSTSLWGGSWDYVQHPFTEILVANYFSENMHNTLMNKNRKGLFWDPRLRLYQTYYQTDFSSSWS